MKGNDFHQAVKNWSRIKHSILGRYLSLLLGKLGRPGERIFYVDGFAGQGRYGDGEEGSPLIAAKLAVAPIQNSRKDILRCINVEQDPETFANLQDVTKPYQASGVVTNLSGTFEENLPSILKLVKEFPAFFFIDPFGTESAEVSTLEAIARRRGKTEVLVRYDDTRVKRLIAWAKNNIGSFEDRPRKTAEAFFSRVAQLTSENAKMAFINEQADAQQALIEGYISEIKRRNAFRFGIYYPVRNPDTGGHRYYLAHFCNHEDGYCYMANFMAKVERTLQGLSNKEEDLFGNKPAQMELLEIRDNFVAEAEATKVNQIVAAWPQISKSPTLRGQNVENRKLFAAIVDNFGYSTTRKEWVKALKQLAESGKLKMEGTDDGSLTRIFNA